MSARPGRGWLVLIACVALLATGCHKKKAIAAVEDLNKEFGAAKDACASVYAADKISGVQKDVDAANSLKDNKKWKKARNKADETSPAVQNLRTEADQDREEAQRAASEAVHSAEAAMKQADEVDAAKLGGSYYGEGKGKLATARNSAKDPCAWPEAAAAGKAAEDSFRRARNAAVAELERLAELEAIAAAELLAAEEEARRLAEEEAWLRAHPPNYVVARGDNLWNISGMSNIYDASKYWPLIYDANRGQINDPDLIYPDQDLRIPREMSRRRYHGNAPRDVG